MGYLSQIAVVVQPGRAFSESYSHVSNWHMPHITLCILTMQPELTFAGASASYNNGVAGPSFLCKSQRTSFTQMHQVTWRVGPSFDLWDGLI